MISHSRKPRFGMYLRNKEPNQALQPTTMPVTFRAYARTAPGMVAAEL